MVEIMIMKRLELASTLDGTGQKRVTLFYDDSSNELFIEEANIIKPVVDTELFKLMINKSIDELKNDMKFCCKGCSRYFAMWYKSLPKWKSKKPPYTKYEIFMDYYWFCLNNNFGQGERTMFRSYGDKDYPVYSYEYVKDYIDRMKKKYRGLGYDV